MNMIKLENSVGEWGQQLFENEDTPKKLDEHDDEPWDVPDFSNKAVLSEEEVTSSWTAR